MLRKAQAQIEAKVECSLQLDVQQPSFNVFAQQQMNIYRVDMLLITRVTLIIWKQTPKEFMVD